jgi:quercetin dioxygenase-like cupin family protein
MNGGIHMIIFRFDKEVGKQIELYHSNFVMSRIIQTTEPCHIGCMHIDAQGVVGYHQAVTPQLFMVVQGKGWVRGEDENRVTVEAGDAVFWEKGEWHESGTDTGMMVIVIESPQLDPGSFMPVKSKYGV